MTRPYFYKAGGSLPYDHPTYVERQADIELCNAIAQKQFCGVIGPAQTGKSSLRIQIRRKLEHAGYCCASLYATQLLDSPRDSAQWDKQLSAALWDSLFPQDIARLKRWRSHTEHLSSRQRMKHFTTDLLFKKLVSSPIVIFIDEIEAILDVPLLAENLFEWIQHCYQLRQADPIYRNLNFAIFGTVDAAMLSLLSPLNKIVTPSGFELASCGPLQGGLASYFEKPQLVLKAIFDWTNGQPLLTQILCQSAIQQLEKQKDNNQLFKAASPSHLNDWVDALVESVIIDTWHHQDRLGYLWDMYRQITHSPYKKQRLALCQHILTKDPVELNGTSAQQALLLSGIAVGKNQSLQIANEIYRQIFVRLI